MRNRLSKEDFYDQIFDQFPRPLMTKKKKINLIMKNDKKGQQLGQEYFQKSNEEFIQYINQHELHPNINFYMQNIQLMNKIQQNLLDKNFSLIFSIFFSIFFLIIGLLSADLNATGAIIGLIFGYISGRKIGFYFKRESKLYQMNKLEDVFLFQLEFINEWSKACSNIYKQDINSNRFVFERVLIQYKFAIQYNYFNQNLKIQTLKRIKQIRKLILNKQSQKSLILSLKLLKIEFSKNGINQLVQYKLNNIFIPLLYILTCGKKDFQKSLLYYKLYRLLQNEQIYSHIYENYMQENSPQDKLNIFKAIKNLQKKINNHGQLIQYINLKLAVILYGKIKRNNLDISFFINKQQINGSILNSIKSLFESISQKYEINDQQNNLDNEQDIKDNQQNNIDNQQDNQQNNIDNQQDNNEDIEQGNVQTQMDKSMKKDLRFKIEKAQTVEQNFHQSFSLYEEVLSQIPQKKQQEEVQISQKQKNEYEEFEEYFALVLNYFQNPSMNWETIVDNKVIKIQKTFLNDNPCMILRCESLIKNIRREVMLEQVLNGEKRQKWDTILTDFQIIDKINDNIDVIYFYVKSPNQFIIGHRSFCQIRIIRYDYPNQGDITILHKKIEHQKCPVENSKKFVRAETLISGHIFTQQGNDVILKILSQVDIKGKIPVMLVNQASEKAPQEWVEKLIKSCK